MRTIWLGVMFAISCGPATPRPTQTHTPSAQSLVASPPPSPATSPLIATDAPAACKPARSIEVLPASENAGSVKLFPSTNGLDMFWTTRGQDARFQVVHAGVTPDGALRGGAKPWLDSPGRHIAAGDPGVFGLVYQKSTGKGWAGRVRAMRGGVTLWDVGLPNQNQGHGTMAIGWDPSTRQWAVVGEELINIDNRKPGYVYNRLFVTRFDERGKVAMLVTYLSEPLDSAQLSDWGNPMIWTGDRFAFAWLLYANKPPHPQRVFVGELVGTSVKHLPITTAKSLFRGAIAKTRDSYALAGGEQCTGRSLCSRVFMTTVRGGVAAPILYLSDERMHSSEAVIASDGSRIAVAWSESDITTGTNRGATVHAAIVDANGTLTRVARSRPQPDQHDWVQSLVWDGCRFVLAHTNGINPSSIQLVMFP